MFKLINFGDFKIGVICCSLDIFKYNLGLILDILSLLINFHVLAECV